MLQLETICYLTPWKLDRGSAANYHLLLMPVTTIELTTLQVVACIHASHGECLQTATQLATQPACL